MRKTGALLTIGKPSIEPLLYELKNNENETIRFRIAYLFEENFTEHFYLFPDNFVPSNNIVEPLIMALNDKSANVRFQT
ncbi:MAG: hypothetical protein HY934_02430 [Candidatus Firestonebacteria bacterium]|nr:hypothetical protein [Candidatus Firestonebacteria bacterium]